MATNDGLERAAESHVRWAMEMQRRPELSAAASPYASINNSRWFDQDRKPRRERAVFHDQLISDLIDASPQAGQDKQAVVLAGPPGAGKSRIMKDSEYTAGIPGYDPDRFISIDADYFKERILTRAANDGSLHRDLKPDFIRELEDDGEVFSPLELASLVHEESSMLARDAREDCIDRGYNIVIDTVLSSEVSATAIGDLLQSNGYSVTVIDVEIPAEVSKEAVAHRWRSGYIGMLKGEPAHSLGGRWVPSEYVDKVFEDGQSQPRRNAELLATSYSNVKNYRVYERASALADPQLVAEKQRRMIGAPLEDVRPNQASPVSNDRSTTMMIADSISAFEARAAELPPNDWTAHRDVAQEAAVAGLGVTLTQTVNNDTSATYPMTHELHFSDPEELPVLEDGIEEREDPMGGSEAVEQFSPNRPHGYYGQRTPSEFSPVQEDWPDTTNMRLSHGGKESVHSTLTQALETTLHDQSELAWIPPKHSSQFDATGPLRADNEYPLLIDSQGTVAAEHVLDAFRAVAEADGQSITVATGREDIGAVFKAEFAPDGSWSLGKYSAENSSVVDGTGPIQSQQVTREMSDALETSVESRGRIFRAEEHREFEEARVDAQWVASRLLTPSAEVGPEANTERLSHAQEHVDDYNRRQEAAYAQAPSSTQEPQVGPEPLLERLTIAHGGDVQAAVASEDFQTAVEQVILSPYGPRYPEDGPGPDQFAYASNVVNIARQEIADAVPASPPSGVSAAALNAVDAQAVGSMENLVNGGSTGSPRANLGQAGNGTSVSAQQSWSNQANSSSHPFHAADRGPRGGAGHER